MDSKQNWEIAKNVGVDKENKDYICEHGEDMPLVRDWRWGAA